MTKPIRILMCCTGNINRSAAAEIILNVHNTEGKYEVKSCGTSKQALDRSRMAPKMRRTLAAMGYDGEGHIAQPYSQELADWADIIVCMEPRHQQRFTKNFDVDHAKFETWNILDPFKHRGETVHQAVAKQIKERVFHRFLD